MTLRHLVATLSLCALAACQPTSGASDAPQAGPNAAFKTFATGFDKRPRYFPPHGPDLARKAVQYDGDVAVWTIEPGFITGDYDVRNGTERAEMGQKVDKAAYVRQSFRVKAGPGLRAPERLLIAQVKPDGPTSHSPAIAAYMTKGGNAKCIDYSGGRQDQRIIDTRSKGVDMLDGQWHRVVMEFHQSDTNGFCRVTIDGRVIVERRGHDSNPNDGFDLVMRIGPYRDKLPYSQTLHYDDWTVEQFRQNPF